MPSRKIPALGESITACQLLELLVSFLVAGQLELVGQHTKSTARSFSHCLLGHQALIHNMSTSSPVPIVGIVLQVDVLNAAVAELIFSRDPRSQTDQNLQTVGLGGTLWLREQERLAVRQFDAFGGLEHNRSLFTSERKRQAIRHSGKEFPDAMLEFGRELEETVGLGGLLSFNDLKRCLSAWKPSSDSAELTA